MSLAPGTRLGPYELIALLGAGGMGEVHRARDTRLDRDVAIKVLPAAVADDPALLARFEREAKIVAGLNHPNIVMLHSIEEAGGVRFLTMELVEGANLVGAVTPGGLPVSRVLELVIPLADALAAAHERGVVHRDLKPANVMATREGRVKVLDFGLAKSAAGGEPALGATVAPTVEVPLSAIGQVMGTVPYMAPEQIRGGAVDARTDLFALGVLAYELATGRRPFVGATVADVSSAILRDAPAPVLSLREDLPPDLGRIIGRCLEKDPERHFQTAKDVRNEFELVRRTLESGPVPVDALTVPGFGGRPAIAVLPFENLSGDPEQEFFAEGLAEDLITRLSLWREFPVIAHGSSAGYRGKAVDGKQVSAELGVRYLVRGSVRKAGTRIRIAVQLIDATTGQNVWSQAYDRELTDVFAVQDEISEAIAPSLVLDLQRAERARVQQRPPENLEAWSLYQRSLASFHRFTPENFAQNRVLLERATALDPKFSTAWARLAEVGIWEVIFGWTAEPERTLADALANARRAVDLDPRDAEAHAELSFALMTAGDGYAALEEARRGMELNPSHSTVMLFRAYMGHMTGHPAEEAIALVQRAMRLSPRDPLEWLFYDVLAGAYFNAGRFEEGLAAGRRLVALWPGYYFGDLWSAMNAIGLGRIEEARAAIADARRNLPGLSIAHVRRVLGAMDPDVDRRMMGALQDAGLE